MNEDKSQEINNQFHLTLGGDLKSNFITSVLREKLEFSNIEVVTIIENQD